MFCLQKLAENRVKLEEQLACWDQIENHKDELNIWLNSMIDNMEDMNEHFSGLSFVFVSVQHKRSVFAVCQD